MQNDSLLPSITPERWPWLVLIVGGAGVLVRTIGAAQPLLQAFQGEPGYRWSTYTLTVVGQAALDLAMVLALFYLVRILVERVWLRRPVSASPASISDGEEEESA